MATLRSIDLSQTLPEPQYTTFLVSVDVEDDLLGTVTVGIPLQFKTSQLEGSSPEGLEDEDTRVLARQVLEQLQEEKSRIVSEFALYWDELKEEIMAVLSDPREMAGIMVEIALDLVIGSFVVQIIDHIREKKRRDHSRKRYGSINPLVKELDTAIRHVLEYFVHTPKSRIAEISYATEIPKERVKRVLEALQFDHEAGCFWKPPSVPIVLSGWQKAKINIQRILNRRRMVMFNRSAQGRVPASRITDQST